MAKIAIICVSYNTDPESVEFISRLSDMKKFDELDIYLVDNSSEKPKKIFNDLSQRIPRVYYIPTDNPGYFGAARLVHKMFSDRWENYEWVIISNVDMHLPDEELLVRLLRARYIENCGVVAPCIYSTLSSKDTNPLMRFRPSAQKMLFYKKVFSNLWTSQLYNLVGLIKGKIKPLFRVGGSLQPPQKCEEIYAPQGSFMIFSAEYFHRGGNFDHGVFLYGEEITVAERCRQLNLKVLHDPSLKVIHVERGSTGLIYSKKTLIWKRESNNYLYDEYFKL